MLHAGGRRGEEVVACCAAARRRGVRAGMPLAEVGLHAPDAVPVAHDPAADRAALEELAVLFMRHLSPRVGLADPGGGREPCGLAADVTGCGHLFGGERNLVDRAVRLARRAGYAARAAVAGCVGAAWGLARFGPETACVFEPRDRPARLDRLPAAAARLPPAALATLRELGVTTVGGVRKLPRSGLPSRFGAEVTRRLDLFDGTRPEPVAAVRPPAVVAATWEADYPATTREELAAVCAELIDEALDRLPAGRGVREAAFAFRPEDDFDPDGGAGGGPVAGPRVLPLAAARPTREAARLNALVALQLDRAALPPASAITLTVSAHERLRTARATLFGSAGDADREVGELVETLSGRLGKDRVRRAAPTGDPLPERSVRLTPALNGDLDPLPAPADWLAGTRPATLLDPPEPVRVLSLVPDGPPFRLARRGPGGPGGGGGGGGGGKRVTEIPSAWGPERIQTGWWRGPRVDRDYWRAELAGGGRVWLFRDLKTGSWFLHGIFD